MKTYRSLEVTEEKQRSCKKINYHTNKIYFNVQTVVLLLTGPILPFTAYIFLHLSKWNTPGLKKNTHEMSQSFPSKSHI